MIFSAPQYITVEDGDRMVVEKTRLPSGELRLCVTGGGDAFSIYLTPLKLAELTALLIAATKPEDAK